MSNIELLQGVKEQLLHMEKQLKAMDHATSKRIEPTYSYPIASNQGTLILVDMAIKDNTEQELITRLYNLVNGCERMRSNPDDYAGFEFRLAEARETLKKHIK
jgi:hypothetical protein